VKRGKEERVKRPELAVEEKEELPEVKKNRSQCVERKAGGGFLDGKKGG
jgi:hypothetical protein